jgi:hypothetical protein
VRGGPRPHTEHRHIEGPVETLLRLQLLSPQLPPPLHLSSASVGHEMHIAPAPFATTRTPQSTEIDRFSMGREVHRRNEHCLCG